MQSAEANNPIMCASCLAAIAGSLARQVDYVRVCLADQEDNGDGEAQRSGRSLSQVGLGLRNGSHFCRTER